MSKDHVGTPRFIMEGFSVNNHAWCYNTINNKKYNCNISDLGVENNYYDEYVEKNILANDVESEGAKFRQEFLGIIDKKDNYWGNKLVAFTHNNKTIVTRMFSYMLFRAKKALEPINKESIPKVLLGEISHSDFLGFQAVMELNIPKEMHNNYNVSPLVILLDEQDFINNSIGFAILHTGQIFIPFDTKAGVVITPDETEENKIYQLTYPLNIEDLNRSIVRYEKDNGNGFFFSKKESDLDKAIEYFHKCEKKNV